jgi:nucleotide-binding universal stress UspA family protein
MNRRPLGPTVEGSRPSRPVDRTLEGDVMYRTIIAGCNGRERGRGAVALAHEIASASGARLLLVGVHHRPPLPFPASYASQREELEHELRAVRDELAPEALIHLEGDMSPAHALRRVAVARSADLLVVGSHHRPRLRRMVEGDQALQVLHGAPCSVAVVPDALAPGRRLEHIGVGIDSTPESMAAWITARELARRTGARLTLYAVVDDAIPSWVGLSVTPSYADAVQELIEDRRRVAEDLLARRLESCKDVRAEAVVVVGRPADELIRASDGLDLLVLGSRRWGPLKRLALGSTSEQVIRSTACPVLVPPRRSDAEHAEALLATLTVSAR